MKKLFILFLLLNLNSLSNASLDIVQRWDYIIGIYTFENLSDSGQRSIDLVHVEDETNTKHTFITQEESKINKGLKVQRFGQVGQVISSFIDISEKGFTITAWIKIPEQEEKIVTNPDQDYRFTILASGWESEDVFRGWVLLSIHTNGSLMGSNYQIIANNDNTYTHNEFRIETDQINLTDNNWHHIAYVKPARSQLYQLFIDGELVKEESSDMDLSFEAPITLISIGTASDSILDGTAYVDEVGLFEKGFTEKEINSLYRTSLESFLRALSVSEKETKAIKWATLKQ